MKHRFCLQKNCLFTPVVNDGTKINGLCHKYPVKPLLVKIESK